MNLPVLSLLGLLPLVGALVTFVLRGHLAKLVGFAFSLATLVLGVVVYIVSRGTDLSEDVVWMRTIGAHWALSSGGLAMVMVLLTVIVVPIVLLAEWKVGDSTDSGRSSTGLFFALALMLESFALLCFMASDVLLFYIFFEATLIPMYFLIGGWGGPRRGPAAMKFLLYSLAGGLVMLFGVIGAGAQGASAGKASFLISDLAAAGIDTGTMGRLMFLAFFIAFAIKAPMVPVHTWLPDTAEQATAGSSTLLVGILDKIGTFGMIRLCLEIFPDSSKWATPVVLVLALVSIIYGALMAITARDLLRLISYTSISHFGFMVLGIFAFTSTSIQGSIFYMLNHGFSTAAMFLVIGFLVKRRGSALVADFGGVQKVAPVLAGTFLVAGLSALSLPGTSSFLGEFMVLAGSWSRHPVYAAIACIGMVLSALYVLLAYQRTMTGPVTDQVATHVTTDLNLREKAVMAPLIALLLVFGFFPKPIISGLDQAVKDTMSAVKMTDPAPAVEGGK
ncbi:NADH-quinone oxidoreductase subunit M [Aestuariimicrobium kwangyangense]|uniref:NADH-quinone oxidoreductase subunit M n=1 Tax=Aestuariimicrobium kwangyangense TaxID=396389 RepID=UPI0003B77C4A|nr:NADH-quinone oxidoreductase subunit M [Aestuariimicrobium kwangyangense]